MNHFYVVWTCHWLGKRVCCSPPPPMVWGKVMFSVMSVMKSYQYILRDLMDGQYYKYLLMCTAGKIKISPVLSFYIDVYFHFYYSITGNLQLPVLNFSSTHVPDKFIELNEFNKILKRENSHFCHPWTMVHGCRTVLNSSGNAPSRKGNKIPRLYRPQRSWDKVMFSHVSVILFTGGGLSLSLGGLGLCPWGGSPSWGVSVQGGLCPGGLCLGGLCLGGGLCHGDTPYGNERAVRFLLECILVWFEFSSYTHSWQ